MAVLSRRIPGAGLVGVVGDRLLELAVARPVAVGIGDLAAGEPAGIVGLGLAANGCTVLGQVLDGDAAGAVVVGRPDLALLDPASTTQLALDGDGLAVGNGDGARELAMTPAAAQLQVKFAGVSVLMAETRGTPILRASPATGVRSLAWPAKPEGVLRPVPALGLEVDTWRAAMAFPPSLAFAVNSPAGLFIGSHRRSLTLR